MTKEEISALAYEYAEEATKTDASDPNLSDSDLQSIKHDIAEYAEEILRFLLRRYYLAKKPQVDDMLEFTLAARESKDMNDRAWGVPRLNLLEFLFPEIRKKTKDE